MPLVSLFRIDQVEQFLTLEVPTEVCRQTSPPKSMFRACTGDMQVITTFGKHNGLSAETALPQYVQHALTCCCALNQSIRVLLVREETFTRNAPGFIAANCSVEIK